MNIRRILAIGFISVLSFSVFVAPVSAQPTILSNTATQTAQEAGRARAVVAGARAAARGAGKVVGAAAAGFSRAKDVVDVAAKVVGAGAVVAAAERVGREGNSASISTYTLPEEALD